MQKKYDTDLIKLQNIYRRNKTFDEFLKQSKIFQGLVFFSKTVCIN